MTQPVSRSDTPVSAPPPNGTPQLASEEREELTRLRAEVAALRAQPPAPASPARTRRGWRNTGAAVLIILGLLLAPLAVASAWIRSEITDTDRYVATVAPLAKDPAIQSAITERVTNEIFTRIDVPALTKQLSDALASRGLPEQARASLDALAAPISNGVQNWTHDTVAKFAASDQFAAAWTQVNRAAHEQLTAVLSGGQSEGGALVIRGDKVSLRLAPFIDAVKQRLVASGFTIAGKLPAINAEFVILQSPAVASAPRYYDAVTTLGVALPIAVLVLLAAGIATAAGRRRALLWASGGLAAAMLALGVALAVARPLYLGAVPADVLPQDAAAAIFDSLVVYLRTTLRTVLAIALIVAVTAFLTGPSSAAAMTRRVIGRGLGAARGGAWRLGLRTGPVGRWVGRSKRILIGATIALAAGVLVLWNYPTAPVVAAVGLACLFVVAVIEIVGTPAGPPQPRTPASPG